MTDLILIVAAIASTYLQWQQNQIFKRQNEIFADQAGKRTMPTETAKALRFKRYWPTMVMAVLILFVGYDLYDRHKTPDYKTWHSPKEETVYAKSFMNETVELDGKKFDRCNFENVKLLYHGLGPVEFVGGTFKGTIWFGSDNIAINQFEIDRASLDKGKVLFPAANWIQMDSNGNPITVQ